MNGFSLHIEPPSYEFPCKIIMQLSRNSYTNKGRTYQTLFFILICYNMVFKMALYLVLEKKETYFYFLEGCMKL